MNERFVFVGGGNMGRAMAAALIAQKVCAAEEILVVEPHQETRETLAGMGCRVLELADETIGQPQVVVVAVKPQSAQDVFAQIKPWLQPHQVLVSIMAGVTLGALVEGLGSHAVVRVMPNTPAQIGMGMNVYYAPPELNGNKLGQVEALLNASGSALRVASEDAIDAATAVSGSGPAYVFYLAENWMAQAEALGFTTEEARTLVQQTLLGATELWKGQTESAGTLRERVTSKGGTTAAALEHFEGKGIGQALREGIQKAYQRAKELGR